MYVDAAYIHVISTDFVHNRNFTLDKIKKSASINIVTNIDNKKAMMV